MIISSNCEKLLGIKFDSKLKFDKHVEHLCKKANQKINAVARISSSMKFEQRKPNYELLHYIELFNLSDSIDVSIQNL